MHNMKGMKIVETAQQLLQYNFNDVFVECFPSFYEIYYWATFAKLCYYLISLLVLEYFVKFYYVGVVHFL